MSAVERTWLPLHLPPAALWQALAAGVARWVATHGLAMQDVVLLLPYA